MGFHNRTVDQIKAIARFRGQLVENTLPDPTSRPTVEAIISRRVRAVACRQIPPRHSGAQHIKYRIHDLAIVNSRALSALRQQRFEQRPVLIAQIKSHDPPPRTVNHVHSNYSIIYLGTDPNTFLTSPIQQGNRLMFKIVAFLKNESGATAIEYGLIAAGIAVAIIAVVNGLGTQLGITFGKVTDAMAAH